MNTNPDKQQTEAELLAALSESFELICIERDNLFSVPDPKEKEILDDAYINVLRAIAETARKVDAERTRRSRFKLD